MAQKYAIECAHSVHGLILCATSAYRRDPATMILPRRPRMHGRQSRYINAFVGDKGIYRTDDIAAAWWAIGEHFVHYAQRDVPKLRRVIDGSDYSLSGMRVENELANGIMGPFDVRKDLREIRRPTLVVSGANDWACPSEDGEEIISESIHIIKEAAEPIRPPPAS